MKTKSAHRSIRMLLTVWMAGWLSAFSLAAQTAVGTDGACEAVYGIVNVSVANLRSKPDFTSEMTTQGLLGMPVRVLQQEGWYRVQLPDEYQGWVHRVGVCCVSRSQLEAWNKAEKIVVTAHYGSVYTKPSSKAQPVSDVVAGDRLKWEGSKGSFYRVSYPDGRMGYIEKRIARPEHRWRKALRLDADAILATAHTLMGVPYLWAGTSSKGMDCSGLVRTVFFMHDVILPRDASQQAYVGQHIDIAPDFSNLKPGDLIFFGRKPASDSQKPGISHVGIYIGHGRFIHSQGDVHISSLVATDDCFDAFNLGRLLFATRILPYINKDEKIMTTDRNPYYGISLPAHRF